MKQSFSRGCVFWDMLTLSHLVSPGENPPPKKPLGSCKTSWFLFIFESFPRFPPIFCRFQFFFFCAVSGFSLLTLFLNFVSLLHICMFLGILPSVFHRLSYSSSVFCCLSFPLIFSIMSLFPEFLSWTFVLCGKLQLGPVLLPALGETNDDHEWPHRHRWLLGAFSAGMFPDLRPAIENTMRIGVLCGMRWKERARTKATQKTRMNFAFWFSIVWR